MNQESFLNDMVNAWLRKDDDVAEMAGEPTWESLSTALEESGHTGIASKLKKKGNHHRKNHDKPKAQVPNRAASVVESSSQTQDDQQEQLDDITEARPKKMLLKEHPSYHQRIPGKEAIRRLKLFGPHCYLTRFCKKSDCYVLSVYKKQKPEDTWENFRIESEDGVKCQIGGKEGEEFTDIEELLHHYEKERISPALNAIGEACTEECYEQKEIQREKAEKKKKKAERRKRRVRRAMNPCAIL